MQFKVTPNDGDPIVHGFTENRTHFMVGSLIPNGSIIHYREVTSLSHEKNKV